MRVTRPARAATVALALLVFTAATPAGAPAATLLHDYPAEVQALPSALPSPDDAVGGVHGTNNGSYTASGAGHAGAFAFDLNGAGQDVRVPYHASFQPSGSFTVSAWVKTTVTAGTQSVMAMDECAGADDPACAAALSTWRLGVKDGAPYAYVRDQDGGGSPAQGGGQQVSSLTAPLVADGTWHQLSLVRDAQAGRISLYRDDRVVVEQVLGSGADGPFGDLDGQVDDLSIGARLAGAASTPTEPFTGQIDDVRFYDGAAYPDATPPVVTPTVLGDATGEWYTSAAVTVQWSVTDESAIRSADGCGDTVITADTPGQTVACTATSAGGTTAQSVTVKHDATAPALTCDQTDPHFAVGDVAALTATVTDATSGPTTTSVTGPIDASAPGSKSLKLAAQDHAGNGGSVTCPYVVDPAPGLSIADASVAEGNAGTSNASFVVTLSAPSAKTITVDYAAADGTAAAPADYGAATGTLTFAPGQTSRTISVPVKGDLLDEPDEAFVVNLTAPANASIADAQATGTIADDDNPPSISINDQSVAEGNSGTADVTFTVTLSTASGRTVKVDYATVDGTATHPADYVAASGTLSFAPGQTSRTVAVAIVGDTIVEPKKTLGVNLANAANGTIADAQGVATILDFDAISNAGPMPSLPGVTEAAAGDAAPVGNVLGDRVASATPTAPATSTCTTARSFLIRRLKARKGRRVIRATITTASGRSTRLAITRAGGVKLPKTLPRGSFTLKLTIRQGKRTRTSKASYRACSSA